MEVVSIESGTAAERAGVRPGDDLVAIDGHPIGDSLDVAFAVGSADDGRATIEWRFLRTTEDRRVSLPARRPEEFGLGVRPDAARTCSNRCIFCFVDQLPRGLRKNLYVKDEDYRLSFAYGNYVTLTNLTLSDYERIAAQRLSPLYVSVHATDDVVRRRMLGNPTAPSIMEALTKLASHGIDLHTQIVVCPGLNDDGVLERTLADLRSIGEAVVSIAVVPVGLTRHREALPRIDPVDSRLAGALVDLVERWQRRFLSERGRRVTYAADELYLTAGRELPPAEAYEDFPQLENGVGLLRSFEAGFGERAAELARSRLDGVGVAIVTSSLAAPFLRRVVVPALAGAGASTTVIAAENTLLGPSVTVAGLLSGRDLERSAREAPADALVLIPAEALNEDGLTIDGATLESVAREAGREHVVATHDIVGSVLEFAAGRARGAGGESR
jgi:putative radical SAM enzyme (TIGR03279 family)